MGDKQSEHSKEILSLQKGLRQYQEKIRILEKDTKKIKILQNESKEYKNKIIRLEQKSILESQNTLKLQQYSEMYHEKMNKFYCIYEENDYKMMELRNKCQIDGNIINQL